MSQPAGAEEYAGPREQGVQLLISLCEDAPERSWLNEAGLFSMHIPVEDMHPPTQKQIELCMSAIDKVHTRGIGVGIHCGAGLGCMGTMLACYFVKKGMSASAAVAHVRKIRPGSIETPETGAGAVSYYACAA